MGIYLAHILLTGILTLHGENVHGATFNLFAHLRVTQHTYNSSICDRINLNIGVMYWEAIRYAIKTINERGLLHGNILTLTVLDTCDKGKIIPPYHTVTYQGFAVIGPYSSESAEFTAKFLSLFRITTISYAATATKLSVQSNYPYFFRTVPNDYFPALIYHELAARFNWVYVAVLYSQCLEGRSMLETLLSLELSRTTCIRYTQSVKHQHYGDAIFRDIISTILSMNIKVVYLFFQLEDCEAFFYAAQFFKWELKEMTFILGGHCGTLIEIPYNIAPWVDMNLITVGLTNPIPADFARHFEALTPEKVFNSSSDFSIFFKAYFRSYWNMLYNCLCDDPPLPSCCREIKNTKYNHLAPVRTVIDAVYAITNAVRRSLRKKCQNDTSCYLVKQDEVETLRNSLKNYMIPTDDADQMLPRLTPTGEIESDYIVYQYQTRRNGFTEVGRWSLSQFMETGKGLILPLDFSLRNSTCGEPCGSHDVVIKQDACPDVCWKCKKCDEKHVIANNTCVECRLGYQANQYRNACLELPVLDNISPSNPLSIGVITFSSICLIAAIVIFYVYAINYDTPIIKATSFELSLFSLAGLILMLITPIVIVMGPSPLVCCLQKIMIGLSLTCCYAPLMLKTNRIYRIFMSSQKFKLKKLALVSTSSLLLLISGMIGVQLVMGIFWIMTDRPFIIISYPKDAGCAYVLCNVTAVPGILNVIFPCTLMIASTFWAFKTRNLPEEFSEIKSIGVTMYITLFSGTCALGVIAIFKHKAFSANYYVLCITYQLVAVVTLIGQYAMKVKILYWGAAPEDMIPKADCPMTGFASVIGNPGLIGSPKTSPNLNLEDELKKFDMTLRRGTASSIASNMRLASPKLKRFSIDLTR